MRSDYAIEASTNLLDWTALFTANSPALPFGWLDADTNSYPQCFCRVWLGRDLWSLNSNQRPKAWGGAG